MLYLNLHSWVHFTFVGDEPVFLDLRRDRYFALDAPAHQAFRRLIADPAAALSGDDAAALSSSGLFTDAAGRPIAGARVDVPSRTLASASSAQAISALRPLPSVWFSIARAREALRDRPLEELVARVAARRRTASRSSARLAELASRFMAARPFVPIRPVCLQDSLAMHHWLAARGAFATLVFGVKLDPFGAHCWLQSEDLLLNESADKASLFAPILVVS